MIEQPAAGSRDATTIEAKDPQGDLPPSDGAALVLVVKNTSGVVAFEIPEGASLTVGRSHTADIVVHDPSLSRLHARISRSRDQIQVVDLGSRNGTWLRGEPISDAKLRVGGTIVMGSVTASIQVAPAPRTESLGLLSTASLLEQIETECVRGGIFGRPLSLVLVRAQGSLGLSALAQRCVPKLESLTKVGPYDPQTLAVLLPETDAAAALRIAQRIAGEPEAGGDVPLACAVASFPDSGTEAAQLLAAASRALQRCSRSVPCVIAKRARRAPLSALPRTPTNPAMLELQRLIERLAPRTINVLVLGETGAGKELVARELHQRSPRCDGPFKVINCAAIPDSLLESVLFGHVHGAFTDAKRDRAGVFAQAHRGTLFLDEIGELSAGAQAALLRALDTRRICPVGGSDEFEVDVRLVAATHRDLAGMAAAGKFRLDLFHRLNSVCLHVPPLRERRDEVEALAEHFIESLHEHPARRPPRLTSGALAQLRAYHWPGNVRELRNVIERALALSDGEELGSEVLPQHVLAGATETSGTGARPGAALDPSLSLEQGTDLALRPRMRSHELALIREALRRVQGNQRRAARLLQLPLRTFERKLHILAREL